MKKILLIISVLLITGCSTLYNTPTKKVEMFFNKYRSLDKDVINQLKEVVNNDLTLTKEQGLTYIEIMKKHYKSLTYKIKDEVIDGDSAYVTVEIEVYDYSTILNEADIYLKENEKEFMKDEKIDKTLFNEYRLEKLKNVNDKVKYTFDISLSRIDNKWEIDELDHDTKDKIQGIYNK